MSVTNHEELDDTFSAIYSWLFSQNHKTIVEVNINSVNQHEQDHYHHLIHTTVIWHLELGRRHWIFLFVFCFVSKPQHFRKNGAITAAKTENGSVSAPEREQIEKSVGFPSDLTWTCQVFSVSFSGFIEISEKLSFPTVCETSFRWSQCHRALHGQPLQRV